MKTCRYCNLEFPEDRFKKGHKCLECRRKQGRELSRNRRIQNPEVVRQKDREYYRSRPDRFREHHLKYTTGISIQQYKKMLAEQNHMCASCGLPETVLQKSGKPFRLAVDHDHETGQVRGLLCMKCNRALGLLSDSAKTIEKLLEYRRRY